MSEVRQLFQSHDSVIFDFDGLILNSNGLKSEAFRRVGNLFSPRLAEKLVQLNERRPGVSRYEKFAEFVSWFDGREVQRPSVSFLASEFSKISLELLRDVEWDKDIFRLRDENTSQKWSIISGADENDLKTICGNLGLVGIFDAGIYGSPVSKPELFKRLQIHNGLVLGDGALDFECANLTNSDFVFVSRWATENSLRELGDKCQFQIRRLRELTNNFNL